MRTKVDASIWDLSPGVSTMDSENGEPIDDRECESGIVEEETDANGDFELKLRPIRVQICNTCVTFKLERDFLFGKCENFERQVTELKLENAELKNSLKNKDKEIQRLMEMTPRDSTAKDIQYDEYNNFGEIASRDTTHNTEDYNGENDEFEANVHNSEEMVFENVVQKEHGEPEKMGMVGKENLPFDRWTDFQEMMCSRMNENGEVIVKEEPEDVEDELTDNEDNEDEEELSEEEEDDDDDDDAWDQPYEVEAVIHEESDESFELPKPARKRRKARTLEATETDNSDRQQICRWITEDKSGVTTRCDQVFTTIKEIVTHITWKHIGKTKPNCTNFLCFWEDCRLKDHAFRVKQKLVNHLRMHTGERPYRCPFEGCGKTFPHKANVYQHKKCHMFTRIPCTYPGCRKIFSRKQNRDDHYRVIHLGDDRLQCTVPDCGKLFAKPASLRAHIERHASEKMYYCKVAACKGLHFPSKFALEQHRVKHAEAKMHKCVFEGCAKMFTMKRDLQKHVHTHSIVVPPVPSDIQSAATRPTVAPVIVQTPVIQPLIVQPVTPQVPTVNPGTPQNLIVRPITPQTLAVQPVIPQAHVMRQIAPRSPIQQQIIPRPPTFQPGIPQTRIMQPGIPQAPIMQPTIVNAPNGGQYMLLLPANMNFVLKPP